MARTRSLEVLKRRNKVASLYLARATQEQIGEALKVNQSTVSRDIKWLEARWREQAFRDINDIVARELADLDDMERDVILRFKQEHLPIWVSRRLEIKRQRQQILGIGQQPIIDQSVNIDASQNITVHQELRQYIVDLGRDTGGQFLDLVAERALGPVLGM